LIAHDPKWREATSSREISLNTVLGADHTFSKTVWKEEVSQLTLKWVKGR
jgi:hypothetical protein